MYVQVKEQYQFIVKTTLKSPFFSHIVINIISLFRKTSKMLFSLLVLTVLILIIVLKFVIPFVARRSQLQKDYQNITLLPVSSVPFIGHLSYMNKQSHVVFQLICQLSKECQDQDKGVFCLWYTLWPAVFLCSAKGLEVISCHNFSFDCLSLIKIEIY